VTMSGTVVAEFLFSGYEGELKDLNGPYTKSDKENHGRPIYAKIGTNQGHKVQMYYWDQRDGDQLHGWWIAPEVGGAHVWAMNPNGSETPPSAGWKVPWHGGVNDKVSCAAYGKRVNAVDGTRESKKAKKDKKEKKDDKDKDKDEAPPPVPPPPPPAAAGPGIFQEWQQQTGISMPWNAVDQLVTGESGEAPAISLPPAQTSLVNDEENLAKSMPVELRKAEFERRTEAQQIKAYDDRLLALAQQGKQLAESATGRMEEIKENPNFKTLLTDKSDGQYTSEDLRHRTDELDRVLTTVIRQIQTSKLATSNKILEGEGVIKGSKIPIALWPEIRKKLTNYVKIQDDLLKEAKEWRIRKEDKEAVLWTKAADSLVDELEGVLAQAEKDVEKLKDASALLSADLSEHLPTNDLLAAASATEVWIGISTKTVHIASLAITEKIPLFKNASPAAFQKFRQLQSRVPGWNEEIQKIQKASLEADKKGRKIQAQEEKAKQEAKEREKKQRFDKWNQNMIDDAWAEVYVVDDLLETAAKEAVNEIPSKDTTEKARYAMVALEKSVEDFIMKPDASNRTREILSSTMGVKVRELRERVTECMRKINDFEFNQNMDLIMNLAGKMIAFMATNKKTERELFEILSKGANVVTAVQVRAWCEVVLEANKEEVTTAIEHADFPRPMTKQTLTLEEFAILFRVYFQACQGATLISPKGDTIEVPVGTLVMLNGPPENKMVPVKAVYGDGSGTMNLDEPGWIRAPCFYKCVTQTCLTDSFKMSNFRIVKRLKLGDRVRVIDPPKVCEVTGVCRMKAQCLNDGKIGYCTLTKSGGYRYFKADPFGRDLREEEKALPSLEGVHCVEGEPIEALKNGEYVLCHLGNVQTNNSIVEVLWPDETIGRVSRKEIRIRGTNQKARLSTRHLSEFVGRIIAKAFEEMKKVVIPDKALLDTEGATLPSDAIRAMGEDLDRQAREGSQILDDLVKYLKDRAQEEAMTKHMINGLGDVAIEHNRIMEELNEFRIAAAKMMQDEINKARAVEMEREEAERVAREKEMEERYKGIMDKGRDLIECLEKLCEVTFGPDSCLLELGMHYEKMEKQRALCEQYFGEEVEMAKKEPGKDPETSATVLNMITLQQRGDPEHNPKIADAFRTLRQRMDDLHAKSHDDALTEIRTYMMKTCAGMSLQETVSTVFDRLCVEIEQAPEPIDVKAETKKEDPDVKQEERTKLKLEETEEQTITMVKVVELKRYEREFFMFSKPTLDVVRSLPWPLKKDQFQLAFLALARVVGGASAEITDENGVVVFVLEVHNLLEVDNARAMDITPDEATLRVRVFGKDKVEGLISKSRVQMLGLKYDIMKETVLTARADLGNLRVLTRLKKGDKVIAVSLPRITGRLLRMRATTLDGTVGWMSMVGNDVDYVNPVIWS